MLLGLKCWHSMIVARPARSEAGGGVSVVENRAIQEVCYGMGNSCPISRGIDNRSR